MELFAADGHDAGGCERVTGKSGMRPERTPSRFLDTLGSESPRIPQQNAPLDTTGRGRNGGNRPFNQGVAGSIPARPTNRINKLRRSRVRRNLGVSTSCPVTWHPSDSSAFTHQARQPADPMPPHQPRRRHPGARGPPGQAGRVPIYLTSARETRRHENRRPVRRA